MTLTLLARLFYGHQWLRLAAALMLASAGTALEAATYVVNFSGSVGNVLGNHWDSSIGTGTPFAVSLTYSTPSPAIYNFTGYSTHVYGAGSATLSYQVGTNLFAAGSVDVTVWNDMLYSGSLIDGYQVASQAGSSPGFADADFYVSLQSLNTGLLTSTSLPMVAYPLGEFDTMAQVGLRAHFSGHPDSFAFMDGVVTSFSITQVPEPSAVILALPALLFAFRKRRTK